MFHLRGIYWCNYWQCLLLHCLSRCENMTLLHVSSSDKSDKQFYLMLGAYCSLQISYHPNADCKPSTKFKPCNGTSRTVHFLCCNTSYFACVHERKVNAKNSIFWEVALCGSCENRPFGGTCRLHLQGRKIRELRKSVNSCYASYEIFYSVSCMKNSIQRSHRNSSLSTSIYFWLWYFVTLRTVFAYLKDY
jgi:hypothetical protein